MRLTIFAILIATVTLASTDVWGGTEIKIKRNPFVFTAPPSQNRTTLQLILLSNEDRSAIINGKRYKIGDTVDNYEIVAITLKYIQITNGRTIKRVFVNESIK